MQARVHCYSAPMPEASLNQLLKIRPLMRFWLARLGGIAANQMLLVAVSWHLYDITGSAWDLGLVGLFQFLPALLMTLPAGHLADRLHRGRIFAACMAVQAAEKRGTSITGAPMPMRRDLSQ